MRYIKIPSFFHLAFILGILTYFLALLVVPLVNAPVVQNRIHENLNILTEFSLTASKADQKNVEDKLMTMEEVNNSTIRFIDRSSANEELSDLLASLPEISESHDIFRDMVAFRLKSEYYNTTSLSLIKDKIEQSEGVEKVFFNDPVSEEVSGSVFKASIIFLGLSVILLIITVLVLRSTVDQALTISGKEIRIMSLVGATDEFIKTPYISKFSKVAIYGIVLGIAALILTFLIIELMGLPIFSLFATVRSFVAIMVLTVVILMVMKYYSHYLMDAHLQSR